MLFFIAALSLGMAETPKEQSPKSDMFENLKEKPKEAISLHAGLGIVGWDIIYPDEAVINSPWVSILIKGQQEMGARFMTLSGGVQFEPIEQRHGTLFFDYAMGTRPLLKSNFISHVSMGMGWRLDTGPYKYIHRGMATGLSFNVSSGFAFLSNSGRKCSLDTQLGLGWMNYDNTTTNTVSASYLRTELLMTFGVTF